MKEKKLKYFVIFFSCLFLLMSKTAYAACDASTEIQLNTAAANMKAEYSLKKIVTDYNGVEQFDVPEELAGGLETGYRTVYLVILRIYNISGNIHFTVTNAEDNFYEAHEASEFPDGVYEITVPDVSKIREYDIKVYSSEGDCLDTELRTINVKTPMYNILSGLEACQNSDKYYCQEYVTTEINVTEEDIINGTQINSQTQQNEEQEKSFLEKYTMPIITAVVVVAVLVVIVYIISKRKKIKF